MQCFSSNPLNVLSQKISERTTYEDIAAWLESNDTAAVALKNLIINENCVAFIQIGGLNRVLCCAPQPGFPGFVMCVRPTHKSRGVLGQATMLLYK